MGAISWTGSWLWLGALALGLALLVLRFRQEAGRGMSRRLWPAFFAEGLALALLVLVLLRPAWERPLYRFERPEVWLVADSRLGFDGGRALGLDSVVDAGLGHWRQVLEVAGFTPKIVRGEKSRLPLLQEDALAAGPNLAALIYFGDGRDDAPNFSRPFHPARLKPGALSEAQPESAFWSGAGRPALRVRWTRVGALAEGAQACLMRGDKILQCAAWPVDGRLGDWEPQEDSLTLPQALLESLKRKAGQRERLQVVLRPKPQGGSHANDTLALAYPGEEGRAALCWPDAVSSLDETAMLRLLAADSVPLRMHRGRGDCEGELVVEHLGRRVDNADLWIAPPLDAGMKPDAGWAGALSVAGAANRGFRFYSDTSALQYAPVGRRFLPPALGRLGDISGTGLWLPDTAGLAACALSATANGASGCLAGFFQSGPEKVPRAFWVLPGLWTRLFREEGDATLARRTTALARGVIAMARTGMGGTGPGPERESASGHLAGASDSAWGSNGGPKGNPPFGLKLGLDVGRLSEWARRSGGAWIDPDPGNLKDTVTLERRLGIPQKKDVGLPETSRIPLDFGYSLFAAVVALLGFSWYWRKRASLG